MMFCFSHVYSFKFYSFLRLQDSLFHQFILYEYLAFVMCVLFSKLIYLKIVSYLEWKYGNIPNVSKKKKMMFRSYLRVYGYINFLIQQKVRERIRVVRVDCVNDYQEQIEIMMISHANLLGLPLDYRSFNPPLVWLNKKLFENSRQMYT